LLTVLQPFGIDEMVQTGTVAMTRGPKGRAARHASVAAQGSDADVDQAAE
jgi:hypothetical protein